MPSKGGWSGSTGGAIGPSTRRPRHPTDETLHEWRKRVKDLWYVLDILQPIRPAFTKRRGEEAHKLADDLGDDHDLAVLRQVLSDLEDRHGVHAARDVILPLIDRRRAELQQDAFPWDGASTASGPSSSSPDSGRTGGRGGRRSRPPGSIRRDGVGRVPGR